MTKTEKHWHVWSAVRTRTGGFHRHERHRRVFLNPIVAHNYAVGLGLAGDQATGIHVCRDKDCLTCDDCRMRMDGGEKVPPCRHIRPFQ